ncbi:hypothetical protein AB4Y89_04525 [Terriglobus sp. 2YAB30_2]|uniref:hypothetical protein n=1 Tax=unclassified Terriglobus TaxID=2628988 RepID=UPI003F98BE45
MKRMVLGLLLAMAGLRCHAAVYYITVAGLGGEPDYEQRFTANAKDLEKVYHGSAAAHVVTLTGNDATRAKLTDALSDVARNAKPEDDLVLILIGHGSFDGEEYKFNLVGPDLSATELAAVLDKIPAKRQLVVNTTSASGGSVVALQHPGRAVITATKTGTEKNATVFARYWLQAMQDPAADTDKSGSVSAMEAFVYADRKTAEFYSSQKRLATEHPVFEDTGKGEAVRTIAQGSREGALLSTFTVLRLDGGNAAIANDPEHQALLAKKEELERKIDQLKYEKAAMEPGEYKQALTAALLELAKVQQEMEK